MQLKMVLAIKPILDHLIYKNLKYVMGAREVDNVFLMEYANRLLLKTRVH